MQPAEDRHSCKLPKAERLCSQLQIAKLIAKKQCFVCYPFKCYYDWDYQTQVPHQFVVSVPKRNFRHAVDRNHIKRLFREAYRKHKHLLPPSSESGLHFHLFFFFNGKEKPVYQQIETKTIEILERINKLANKI